MIVPGETAPAVVAGSVALWSHDEDGAEPITEIGWMVLPEFQGRGLAKQVVRMLLELARDDGRWGLVHAFPATGKSGVAAVGVSQEFQRVWSATRRDTRTAAPQYTFAKADRRVTCYYFYLWDEDFGPAFIKVCAWFPYPAKIWVNGHEWARRQAGRAGIAFTELSNGFASCDDPAGLQAICGRLQPGTIEVFAQRWLHRIPMPFGTRDRDAGYWWECSMRQVEVSRTIVFDAAHRARSFFEA